jgi:hypothetical protein
MKKVLLILLIFLVFTSCIDEVIEQVPPPTIIDSSVFDVKESKIVDGQDIYFTLPSTGVYTLTLIDKETNQVISRERFNGTIGQNKKNIYIKSIQSRYLYLVLSDIDRKEINRTKLVF